MMCLPLRYATALVLALFLFTAGCDEGPLEDINQGIPTFLEVMSDTSAFDSAAPGAALPVVLRVTDPYGDIVPGAQVVWRPNGDGETSVEPNDTTRTDAEGITEAQWRVGEAGTYRLGVLASAASIELAARVR